DSAVCAIRRVPLLLGAARRKSYPEGFSQSLRRTKPRSLGAGQPQAKAVCSRGEHPRKPKLRSPPISGSGQSPRTAIAPFLGKGVGGMAVSTSGKQTVVNQLAFKQGGLDAARQRIAEEGRVLALALEAIAADEHFGLRVEDADISRRTDGQRAGLDAE